MKVDFRYSRAKFGRLWHMRPLGQGGTLSRKAMCGFEPTKGYGNWALGALESLTHHKPCGPCLEAKGK